MTQQPVSLGGADRSPITRFDALKSRVLELRWWIAAVLLYCVVMGHLEGIDPARPEKIRLVRHALVAGLGAIAFPVLGWTRRRSISDAALAATLWGVAMAFLVYTLRGFVISHRDEPAALSLLVHTIQIAVLAAAIAWPLSRWAPQLHPALRLAPWFAAIALLMLARVEVFRVSPHPRIDVFTLAREAANALWRGENPYAADTSNLYEGTNLDLGYSPGYNYLPAMLLANSLSHKLGDVRFAYAGAEILCAVFIWRFARALGWSRQVACALALAWSANSLSFQVVEKWNDSIVLAALLGTVAFLAERRWILAGVMFGLGLATKQYLPLAAVPLAVWLWRSAPPGALKRGAIATAVTAGLISLPFLVYEGHWLVARTMLHYARTPFREDSISLLNLSRILIGFPLDSWVIRVSPFVGLITGMVVAIWAVTRRQPAAGLYGVPIHRLLVALLCVWAAFFHTIKQSFLNYHYFYFSVAVLLLVSMVTRRSAPGSSEPQPSPPR